MKLPLKFKKKWLKALRSGEYEQCTGRLHDDGKYCCLGVANHLHGVSNKTMDGNPKTGCAKEYFGCVPKYMEALQDRKDDQSHSMNLIRMNDGGKSFKQIAEYIQKNL